MRRLIVLVLATFTACSGGALTELRRVEMRGTPYQQKVAQGYQTLAEELSRRHHGFMASRVAEKGLSAAYGHDVLPEAALAALSDRHLPVAERDILVEARHQLLPYLNGPVKDAMPEIAAEAVVSYDCWLIKTADPLHYDAADICRERFFRALATLQSDPGEAVAPAPTPIPTADPLVEAVNVTYLVTFDNGKDSLNKEATEILETVLTDLHNIDQYQVVVNGHADAAGNPQANEALSLRRANRVSDWLKRSGVPAERIGVFAFGETDPAEAASDRSAKNRRVEVVIE